MTGTPLPNPCPVCGGVVLYGGRGRRPVYCGPECKASTDAESRPLRRRAESDPFLATDLEPVTPELDGSHFTISQERFRAEAASAYDDAAGDPSDGFGVLAFVPDGYAERGARSRRRGEDRAAEWLREHAPEALADFGADY